jgi:hypothetical protein
MRFLVGGHIHKPKTLQHVFLIVYFVDNTSAKERRRKEVCGGASKFPSKGNFLLKGHNCVRKRRKFKIIYYSLQSRATCLQHTTQVWL